MYKFVCFGSYLGYSSFRFIYTDGNKNYFISSTEPGVKFTNLGSINNVKRPFHINTISIEKQLNDEEIKAIFHKLHNDNNKFISFNV